MSIIKVNCVDQTLVFENTPVIASGGLEENFVQFSFCSQWDGFTKTAVFWRSESEVFHNLLDAENSCQVAPEVTASDGVIYFGVFGVDSSGRQRTSEVLTYRVVKGAISEGTVPSDPTPDIYTQLLTKYQEMLEVSKETLEKEQAFEKSMTERQNTFEETLTKKVDDDQEAFEKAMTQDQADFEQDILQMIADGLLPDDSVATEKLKNGVVTTEKIADGAVTAEKVAPGLLVDAYNKTETLTTAMKALFGLGASAVPNDVFGVLSRFHSGFGSEYVWAKAKHLIDTSVTVSKLCFSGGGTKVKYSSTCENKGGYLELTGDVQEVIITTSNYSVIAGKYFITPSVIVGTDYVDKYQNIILYSPGNPYVDSANPGRICTDAVVPAPKTEVYGYVNSPNQSAYPVSDGYTYIPLGQLGNKLQIATGSYTGTGTFGSANPNSLTFDFSPKFVYVQNPGSPYTTIVWIAGANRSPAMWDNNSYTVTVTHKGNTLEWYCSGNGEDAYDQLNATGIEYVYIAIG